MVLMPSLMGRVGLRYDIKRMTMLFNCSRSRHSSQLYEILKIEFRKSKDVVTSSLIGSSISYSQIIIYNIQWLLKV